MAQGATSDSKANLPAAQKPAPCAWSQKHRPRRRWLLAIVVLVACIIMLVLSGHDRHGQWDFLSGIRVGEAGNPGPSTAIDNLAVAGDEQPPTGPSGDAPLHAPVLVSPWPDEPPDDFADGHFPEPDDPSPELADSSSEDEARPSPDLCSDGGESDSSWDDDEDADERQPATVPTPSSSGRPLWASAIVKQWDYLLTESQRQLWTQAEKVAKCTFRPNGDKGAPKKQPITVDELPASLTGDAWREGRREAW